MRGTLPLTLSPSSAGHTFLVTAWFFSAMTPGVTWSRLQSMPSNSRPAASQARKSASVSRVVEARGGGGRARGSQSLRWRKIFSMIAASSMKLMIRNRPPHLGQASGSAAQTLRINRAQARLQWRRKSSGSGLGAETATGVMPGALCCCRRRCPRVCLAKILYRGELAPGGLRIILAVAMASCFGWSPIAVGNDGITGVSEKKQVDILFFLQ